MRGADVIVIGAGAAGVAAAEAVQRAGARALVLDKAPMAPQGAAGLRVLSHAMVVDLILTADGVVSGVLFADGERRITEAARAKAVILATGGIDALFPSPPSEWLTGDGLVLATRAGATLDAPRAVASSSRITLEGGVACDAAGTTSVPGLFVTGSVAATVADATRAGTEAAAWRGPESVGAHELRSTVDTPLPPGFVDVKFARLREVLATHLIPDPRDIATAMPELRRLKGEANEYARARMDVDLLSFEMACEAAVILASAAKPA